MSVYPKDKTSEVVGLLCFASFVMLTLSLVSYSPLDPSLNTSSSGGIYSNYAGRVGAWISDTLLQGFGLGAVVIPLALLVVGFKLVRRRPLEYPFLKLAGLCCALMALCALLTLLTPSEIPGLEFVPGGVSGILVSDLLLTHLNRAGSIVVAATVLLLSAVLTTRFSIEGTLERAGKIHFNPVASWRGGYSRWRKRRQERKELARLKKTKTVMAQPVPKKISMGSNKEVPALAEKEPQSIPEVHRSVAPSPSHGDSGSKQETLPAASQRVDLNRPYRLPSLNFLQAQQAEDEIDEQELIERAHKLTTKCAEFDVLGRVVQIHPGPVVTTFEFKPDAGVKYNRVTGLADDLCLALKAESIRIDRIPGKNTVGIEAPNITRQTILLRDIFSSAAYEQSRSKLTLGLGKLINGSVYIADLVRMPHLLIAGATGSGKSVALNGMVCSVLYKAHPAEVRFIMIDPKRLELGVYDGIPHLLTPIVTDPKQAANALNWAVNEMEERYRLLAQHGVRNIEQYNRVVTEQRTNPELEPLPYIVIIVDELADLMMTAGKDVEAALTRLAQMARAIGIHLILATQRPSVDVLTGLIKANFPCRISFRVSSKVDSRTILDCNGAEQLLGNGDSLLLSPGSSRLVRVHGAFISEGEIARVVGFLKEQASPEYREEILEGEAVEDGGPGLTDLDDLEDQLYEEAARFVVETGKASTSLLQRRLRIGYGRAARLLDMMQHDGLIGPPDGSKAREVLVPSDYFDEPFRN
jgi:DNA segregation ATPase FtsK/SpoIIIE, S-DNA-T family